MSHLRRAVTAIVVALGLLFFVGTAVAQDESVPSNPMLPYVTQEECEANGGVWAFDFCVDPEKVEERNAGQAPAAPAEAVPAPTQPGAASRSQPAYTG